MSTSNQIIVSTPASGVQTWAMGFAPANGIGPTLLDALHGQLAETLADDSISAVVLASDLEVFSAGADATWMREVAKTEGAEALLDVFVETMDGFRDLSLRLRRSPVLVIAALGGHTLAGGLELAAACDLRFAADEDRIKLGVPEMDLFGQLPDGGGGVQFLSRLMGPSQSLQFILGAKPVSPRTARELGLVDRLCPPVTLRAEAEQFAAEVAKKTGRTGVAAAKQTVFGGWELPLDAALDLDRSVHWDSVRRGDFAGTVQRFVERFASSSQ